MMTPKCQLITTERRQQNESQNESKRDNSGTKVVATEAAMLLGIHLGRNVEDDLHVIPFAVVHGRLGIRWSCAHFP